MIEKDIRKQLNILNKTVIWINTHGSKTASTAKYIVPCATYFEQEGTFVNLEERAQKTLKTLTSVQDSRSIKRILFSMYPNVKQKALKALDFLYEIVNQPELFKTVSNKFNRLNINGTNPLPSINFVSNYPLKSSIEDFYRSNNLSKNSVTMAKCSQEQVKTINNF